MTNKERSAIQFKINSLRASNAFWTKFITANEATIAELEAQLAQEAPEE